MDNENGPRADHPWAIKGYFWGWRNDSRLGSTSRAGGVLVAIRAAAIRKPPCDHAFVVRFPLTGE